MRSSTLTMGFLTVSRMKNFQINMKWYVSLLLALLLELTFAEYPCGDGRACMPFFRCRSGEVVTDGVDLLEIRQHSFLQCPHEQDTIAKSEPITIRRRRQADDGSSQCHFLEICCDIRNTIKQTTSQEHYANCGYRNPNGVIFMENVNARNIAKTGEFPWMVRIQYKKEDKFLLVCSGAIIAPTVILTAAHCVDSCKAENYLVRTVESPEVLLVDRFDNPDLVTEAKYQQLTVRRIRIHDQYDKKSLVNDIALLIVHSPGFEWQDTVRPICLPKSETLFDSSRCLTLGFTSGSNKSSIKIFKAPLVSNLQCQQLLSRTRLGKYFELDNSFICADEENDYKERNDCHDRGGAALVCPMKGENNRYYLVGVNAWGIECVEKDSPEVYASIQKLYRWIDYTLDSERIDSRHYSHTNSLK